MTNLDSIFKSRDITLLTKLCLVKTMVFPVVMYGCESWTIKKAEPLKNWYFWTVVCWRRLSSPLDCKVVKPVNPKGNQSCIFIRKTDVKLKLQYLTTDMKSQLTGKDPDAGQDSRQEKGMTEDEMVGENFWFNGHELEQALGNGKDCEAWHAAVHRGPNSYMTEWLNNYRSRPRAEKQQHVVYFRGVRDAGRATARWHGRRKAKRGLVHTQ